MPPGRPTSRSILRELFSLAAPVIGLNLLVVTTLVVDTAMCGRLPNAETALTALSFAVQIVFLLLVAMIGMTVGTVALISRAHGGGDTERVNHVLAQSTQLTVLLGLVAAVLGNLLAGPALHALGASDEVVESGLRYLRPLLSGTVFYYLTILYAAVFRGVGNTRVPFLCALGANLLNLFLDYTLILGNLGFPALGVQGAAIATVAAQIVNTGLLIWVIRSLRVQGLSWSFRPRAIDRPLALELYRVGAPAALDLVILNASFLSIVAMLGHIDEVAVAAHGVGLRIQSLAFVPGLGVSQATAALVGQALGAGEIERTRRITRASLLLCTAIMSALAAAIVVAAYPIVSAFDVAAGTELEAYSVQWMRLLGYGMPWTGVHIALFGLLQGAGATRTTLRISATATLLQIPLGAILGFPLGLGAFGIWLSFPISFLLRAILGALAYRRGKWAVAGLRAAEE